MPINKVLFLATKYAEMPLSDQVASRQLFGAAPSSKSRTFVNWRKVNTAFAVMSSKCPTRNALDSYAEKLSEVAANGVIDLENFVQVSAWFDVTEGASDRSTQLSKETLV